MHKLTAKEQETFREDYQEKEREIQRYIGVYLSGLALVTGWVIGPQSKPLLEMALGNAGYNVYAFLIIVALNVLFTCFLIYKSIIVHEITQFMTYLSSSNTGFSYWESWRRSPQSATKPVRAIYTILLGILPLSVSFLIMFGMGRLLYSDAQFLVDQLKKSQPAATGSLQGPEGQNPISLSVNPESLAAVFQKAKVWFWVVAGLHLIPFYFFYINVVPTNRRWAIINGMRGTDLTFETLTVNPATKPNNPISGGKVNLYDNETNAFIARITEDQLKVLVSSLEEESEDDTDYYLDQSTLEWLGRSGADGEFINKLRKAMGQREGMEIRYSRD